MKKFHIGDRVRVKKLQQNDGDPETSYYVESFAGKTGQLFDVTRTSRGVPNFHVNFGKDIGVFYENEIELVTD
jgi:hypothetical protein